MTLERTMPLLLLVSLAAAPAAAATARLSDVAWLAGSWAGEKNGRRVEEHWTPPRAGTMLATGRTLTDSATVFFEFLRIEQRADAIYYTAWPRGRGETSFRLVSLEGGRAVFENLEHDFPQRIIYRREQDGSLHARTEGLIRSKLEGEDFVMRRLER